MRLKITPSIEYLDACAVAVVCDGSEEKRVGIRVIADELLGIDGVLFSAQSWDDCFQWVIRNGHTTASIYYSGADGVMR